MQKCTPWPGQAYSLFAYVSKTSNLAWLGWIRSRESGAQRFVHASQNQCWGPCDYLIFSTIILPIVVRKGATDAPYTIADMKYRWTDVSRTYTNSVHETRWLLLLYYITTTQPRNKEKSTNTTIPLKYSQQKAKAKAIISCHWKQMHARCCNIIPSLPEFLPCTYNIK